LKKTFRSVVAYSVAETKTNGEGFYHSNNQYTHHSRLKHHETAFESLTYRQSFTIVLLLALLVLSIVLDWHAAFTTIIAIVTIFYFLDILFNAFLIYRGFQSNPEIKITHSEITSISKKEWPRYTILCPLYKEAKILPQFIKALSHLDYEESKLQVLLLLEENDKETIKVAKKLKKPGFVEILIVPASLPQTKPKACNFGLKHATGEYVVIYDAEDIPEPEQLKKAYLAFKRSDKSVVCIQCKLDFYNPHQNILTKIFTGEYALWFNLVLPGLQSIKSPIPLGGTSNHFKTKQLRSFGAWDAFNVTEDADLGMRIARKGYHTAILDSTTMEEANSQFKNWFGQRRRWLKGYMQTYLVHTRDSKAFKRPVHSAAFKLVIGGKVFSALISPIFWMITISYFIFRSSFGSFIQGFYPLPVLYIACVAILFGNFLYLYYYMLGCAKRNRYDLIRYAYLVPVYWLMMSAAAWSAVYEIIVNPHYWSKTTHGLFLGQERVAEEVDAVLMGTSSHANTVKYDEE